MREKTVLDDLGFGNVWNHFDNTINYLPLFKQRLRHQFIQSWNTFLHTSSKFKTIFGFEKYIDVIQNDTLRKQLS